MGLEMEQESEKGLNSSYTKKHGRGSKKRKENRGEKGSTCYCTKERKNKERKNKERTMTNETPTRRLTGW